MKDKRVILILSLVGMVAIFWAGFEYGNGFKREQDRVESAPTLLPGLITSVQFESIIASTADFGTEVNPNNPPPPPWRMRLKIALNTDSLNTISGNRNFIFNGTLINFKGSDGYTCIAGFRDTLLVGDTLRVDFWIPEIIPTWNRDQDSVVLRVKVTDGTASLMTEKAGFSLLPLALITQEAASAEDESDITEVIYKDVPNGFTGTDDGTGNTKNGPTSGTDIDDPD